MTGRIVVGFTGDTSDSGALEWAVEYAQALDVEIELVHVVDDSWGAIAANLAETALLQAEHQLREVAQRARESAPGVTFHSYVTVGSPTEALTDRSSGTDLLVVGTRAQGRIDERLFGTRGAQIASRAHCSVVIVPERNDDVAAATGSGVVVGVDGSDASISAVKFAAQYADRYREPLQAVYAWNPPTPWTGVEAFEWPTVPSDDDHLVLAQSVAGITDSYPELELKLTVASALPADALNAAARGARLLVVGTHGRRGLSKFWLGSVSRDVAQLMPCPIAVIRSAAPRDGADSAEESSAR